jgi:iron-sulfur cluster assembly protein
MIQITETAAQKIRTLMAKQGIDEGGLRVGVKGGGCSGLSYIFAWEREARFGDEVFEGAEGAKIFIDKKSLLYLNGTVLDYDTSLISRGFVFNNPNAKSTCGCGSSFGA